MKEAAPKCRPVLLEPIMAMEVTTPEAQLGDVIGDLNQKRGVIELMTDKSGGVKNIKCQVSTRWARCFARLKGTQQLVLRLLHPADT